MDNQQNNFENQVLQTVVVSQPVQQVALPQKQTVPKVKNNRLSTGKLVLLFIITVVISVFIGAGSVLAVLKMYPDLTQEKVTNVTRLEKEISITDEGIADAVDKIYDSVVIVKTYRNGKLYATGTGFVYKKENGTYYLLTNYHVIQDGEKVEIVFTDNTVASVNVQGGDKYSDIAVLTYRTDNILDIATMGSSVDMRVGDTVFAIGSPLDSNVYSWSVTRGVLSGKDREVEVSTNNTTANDWIMQVLQTDAAINSGNSGGPLCNSNGAWTIVRFRCPCDDFACTVAYASYAASCSCMAVAAVVIGDVLADLAGYCDSRTGDITGWFIWRNCLGCSC